jgi:hypothetical protein
MSFADNRISAMGTIRFGEAAYRLKSLADAGRLVKEGEGRWAKYRLLPLEQNAQVVAPVPQPEGEAEVSVPLSPGSTEIRRYLRQWRTQDIVKGRLSSSRPLGTRSR